MKFSRGLSVFLLLTLPLTLSFRVLAGRPPQSIAPELFERTVSEFLSRNAYDVTVRHQSKRPLIRAVAKDCRIAVLQVVPEGWSDDALRVPGKGFTDRDGIVFVYRGHVLREQPTAASTIRDIWTRFRQRLGIGTSWTPILAVRSSPACSIEALPWGEIAEIRSPGSRGVPLSDR